jgi:Fur family ferric uptake transcriptional regulator
MKTSENNYYLIEKFREAIAKNNMKNSKQREYIFQTLIDMKYHCTPEELYDKIKITNKTIGVSTVYRTLSFLEKESLIKSISFGVMGKKYEVSTQDKHDHIICHSCGDIVEFVDTKINTLISDILKENDFTPVAHSLELYGICITCQNK